MKYIQRIEKKIVIKDLICSHPQVAKIWQYGGGAEAEGSFIMYHNCAIVLKNGERKVFELSSPNDFRVVEEYLQTLQL